MKKTQTLFKLGLFGSALILISFSSGPGGSGQQVSGAPGEGTCTNCHASNALNSGAGSISVAVDGGISNYVPGNTYTINVTGTGSTASKYGFQLVSLKTSDDTNAGTFTASTGTQVVTLNSNNYIEHSTPSTTGSWQVQWQAPSSNVGDIKFYVSGNSAETPGGTGGDNIYTSSFVVSESPVSVTKYEASSELSLFPNPSVGSTTLSFSLSKSTSVSIIVTDLSGKQVLQLNDNTLFNSGVNKVNINTATLSSGVYLAAIQGEGINQSIKLIKQ